ncbi:MAG TPA: glutamate racemase [Verrucomicrobiae bacterium]|nr:glutamate racemase [Verrucomicrobiae bacterium]
METTLEDKAISVKRPKTETHLFSRNDPIGVFDSGLGGLTIVRELRNRLPLEAVTYFGDIARLPYGTKSREQIKRFSRENSDFLLRKGIKALVIACNSSSSAAYAFLKSYCPVPVLDVISPAVEAALHETRTGRVGVIGTSATVESGAYERALEKRSPGVKVTSLACPLFVPIVEEGMMQEKVAGEMVAYYLAPLKKRDIDVLILGCTHYPMLKASIARYMGAGVRLIDSAGPCVANLSRILAGREMDASRKIRGKLKIFVSDLPRNFVRVGENFLREKLSHLKVVRESVIV